ncbi:hypothetical protein P389DRAFT_193829 [Cystobasidium minutum MCA 4210]|uniref:uncharacterized protein n=1 Tax=Cystobasidium minutum MCA 4210 TaxID=1397322 RepID=UPI0034CDC950|eukprot:jgi/Rhomi1/193829/gm1.2043_g
MSITSAVGNLFQAIFDIIAGIFNTIFALIQTIWAAVYGVISTALASAESLIKLLWSALPILLVVGMTILIYQIFVVDKGRAPRTGAGRKKVA